MAEPVRASELDAGLGWLNTDRPLRFGGELGGQVVVLDFWTYCCVNCMHVLPDLAYLEHKYRDDPVTFVGVHSAKFTNEASPETIRAAILRYEIHHPVVIDDRMKIWRSYGVRSWPTLVIVGSTGHIVGSVAGEGNRDTIDVAIAQALEQGRQDGTLAKGPLVLRGESSVRATSGLAFPGKVLADGVSGKLFVADSNHNRIIIAEMPDTDGKSTVVRVVGSGQVGARDGAGDVATFNHPQGLAIGQGNLYVADTENHLIRAIDLQSFEVTTIVGTGQMSDDRTGGLMGTGQGLNSPWDLAVEGSTLYVAMAGIHQIWRIDLPVGFARALAGSGRENIVDGPVETAALAQPSGICIAGDKLYFADAEVSAIRGINLSTEQVFTVIGDGLFSFGDVDGVCQAAKFQHPLGVQCWGDVLLVADTYNHKIKLVDPAAKSAKTLWGTGKPATSTADGMVAFFEPGGLAVAGDRLFVADTNNHRVVEIDLKSHKWREVVFEGLSLSTKESAPQGNAIEADPVSLAADREIELILEVELPEGMHLSSEASWSVRVTVGDTTIAQQTDKSEAFPFRVMLAVASVVTGKTWRVVAAFACCTSADGGLCVPFELVWNVRVEPGGEDTAVRVWAKVEGGRLKVEG